MYKEYNAANRIPAGIFDEVYALLSESLPQAEMRTKDEHAKQLDSPYYRVITRCESGRVTAFLGVWEFESFRYVEHLAVSEALRGKGVGGEFLQWYQESEGRPVILEVERMDAGEMAVRRIGFYKRHGFALNPYAYFQPPLQPCFEPLPLSVMSFPHALSEREFQEIRALLYREVYRVEPPNSGV